MNVDHGKIVRAIDHYLDKEHKEYCNTMEANAELARLGLLHDSERCPGEPIRALLRVNNFLHAYKVDRQWRIPHSGGKKIPMVKRELLQIEDPLRASKGQDKADAGVLQTRPKSYLKRVAREKKVVELMIRLYCRKKEGNRKLCPECAELLEYSRRRLEYCLFGSAKPSCKKCPIHCYKPAMRERIRTVMRFSGPRMMLYHPLIALRHLFE